MAVSSSPAAWVFIECTEDGPHEVARPLGWSFPCQPFELKRHENRATQFVELPVIATLRQNLSSEKDDGLPPIRVAHSYPEILGVLRYERTKEFRICLGEDAHPCPIRNILVSRLQMVSVATREVDVAFLNELSSLSTEPPSPSAKPPVTLAQT